MSNKMKLYDIIASVISLKRDISFLSSEYDIFMSDDEEYLMDLLSDILDILLNYTVSVSD